MSEREDPARLKPRATDGPARLKPRATDEDAVARGFSRASVLAWQVGLAVIGLGAWQAGVSMKLLDPFFFSRPSAIAQRIGTWIAAGSLWPHLAITLEESLLGLIAGSVIGVTMGFGLARSPFAANVLDPYIKMLNAVPRVVLAPLFLLWFGLGIWSKVAIAVTLVFFVMFFNTYQGVRDADRVIIDNVRMLGASERQLVRHVLIPSALTWIFSSLQTSLGFAMVGAVVGEYLGATRGLGYVISQAEGTFDTTGVFAGMTVLSIVVVIVSAGVTRLERWLLRWKSS
jgi:NitT/TauT family transport system permease protein